MLTKEGHFFDRVDPLEAYLLINQKAWATANSVIKVEFISLS